MSTTGREQIARGQRCRRILYVITDLEVGGAERCLVRLATHMHRLGWRVAVCSLMPAGALAGQLAAAGIRCCQLGLTGWWHLPAAAMRLACLMAQFRPAIVHTFLFHANVLARLVARSLGVSAVVGSVRVAEPRRWHLAAETLTARLADRLVCVSRTVAEYMVERAHVPGRLIEVIPNGVDVEHFAQAQPISREQLGVPADAPLLISVARLDEQKGWDTLLAALARASSAVPGVYLAAVGDGPLRGQLQRLAERLGIRDRLVLLGRRDDVPQLLRAADLFVLASRWEGMPNALLEAMAAGLPVLATAAHGCSELISDGATGRLVPVGDAAALGNAIIQLLTDPGDRRRLATAGQQHVAKHFSMPLMLQGYAALYAALCPASEARANSSKQGGERG